jgi:hypothetical protein
MTDDLSKKIEALRKHVSDTRLAQKKQDYYSTTSRVRNDTAFFMQFLYQLSLGLDWIWRNIFHPIWRAIKFFGVKILCSYIWCWNKLVYRKDAFGQLMFSKTRAGLMVLCTILFMWKCFFPIADLGYDTILYVVTAHVGETVILLGSQEIDSKTGSHIIEGCHQLPCSDVDAIYFRTEDNLFNNLWSIFHGRG